MKIEFSPLVDKKLRQLKQKDSHLAKIVEKQLALFAENPKHPSLRVHKLAGDLENLRSISVNRSVRMSYVLEGDVAYFIKIGTHDEVYKK